MKKVLFAVAVISVVMFYGCAACSKAPLYIVAPVDTVYVHHSKPCPPKHVVYKHRKHIECKKGR